jgi:hypothetical protein
MTYLYPDTPCPVCGSAHTLAHRGNTLKPGDSFSFVCPDTQVIVVCRPARGPEPVARVPDGSVPVTRLPG